MFSQLLLLLLPLLLAFLTPVSSVQLSEIFNLPQYQYFPIDLRTFPDDTALLAGTSTFPIPQLSLSPFVTVPPTTLPFSETQVIARLHPQNRTLIWAAALGDLENGVHIAVDPHSNSYVAGFLDTVGSTETANTVRVTKFGPKGNVLWTQDYADPSFGAGPAAAARRGFWFDGFNGRSIQFTRGRLVLSGIRPSFAPRGDLLALVIKPRNGKLLAVRPLRAPKNVTRPMKEAFAAAGGVACIAVTADTYDPVAELSKQRLFVQCRRLSGGRAVTRELTLPGVRLNSIDIGMIDGKRGRSPQLWVVYSSGKDPKKAHDISIYRMDAKTLDDVDWKTGYSTRVKNGRLGIRFTTPGRLGEPGFVYGVEYSSRLDSLVVGYASTARIKKVLQKKGQIRLIGSRAYTIPSAYYVMFFDSSQRLKLETIADDPRTGPVEDDFNHLLVTSLALSADEKNAYLFGFLQKIRRGQFLAELGSGPFYVHTVPAPGGSV